MDCLRRCLLILEGWRVRDPVGQEAGPSRTQFCRFEISVVLTSTLFRELI